MLCKKAPWRKNLDIEFKQQYSTAYLQKKHKKNVSSEKYLWLMLWRICFCSIINTTYNSVFPALGNIAEMCLSMPVSNAWPERGCSALKRIKTRLRNRLSADMPQSLLILSINGPELGTIECEALITAAVEKWRSQRKRRKIPKHGHATSVAASALPQMDTNELSDACVQTNTVDLELVSDDGNGSEVEIASAALNLTADTNCRGEADSDYDSECDNFNDMIF